MFIEETTGQISTLVSRMNQTEISNFIRVQTSEKHLSKIVGALNKDIQSNDGIRRSRAESALKRLGFL